MLLQLNTNKNNETRGVVDFFFICRKRNMSKILKMAFDYTF